MEVQLQEEVPQMGDHEVHVLGRHRAPVRVDLAGPDFRPEGEGRDEEAGSEPGSGNSGHDREGGPQEEQVQRERDAQERVPDEVGEEEQDR